MSDKLALVTGQQPAGLAARFRLTKAAGVVCFHGPLNCSSNLGLLADLTEDHNAFDLSGIESVSWAGIMKLQKHLATLGKPVRITGIPKQVYRYLRLLLLDQANVSIDEAEFDTFNPQDPQRPGESVRLLIADLERLAVEQGPIMTLPSDRQVLGIAEHICPRYFQRQRAAAPIFTNDWCLSNNNETLFWYNFAHLSNCILGLGLDLIETARQGLGPCSSEISHRLTAFEQGAELVDLPKAPAVAARLLGETHGLDGEVTRMHAKFAPVLEQSLIALRSIQVACWSQSSHNPEAMLAPLAELCAQAAKASPASLEASAYKARISPAVKTARTLANSVVALDPLLWTDAALPQLRDLFALMNPLSEGDWTATLEDLVIERDVLLETLRNCAAHLDDIEHGCAMLRRWCDDMRFMQEALLKARNGHSALADLRQSLFNRLRGRQARPEETYSYGFYFPDFLAQTSSADGDEILFETA